MKRICALIALFTAFTVQAQEPKINKGSEDLKGVLAVDKNGVCSLTTVSGAQYQLIALEEDMHKKLLSFDKRNVEVIGQAWPYSPTRINVVDVKIYFPGPWTATQPAKKSSDEFGPGVTLNYGHISFTDANGVYSKIDNADIDRVGVAAIRALIARQKTSLPCTADLAACAQLHQQPQYAPQPYQFAPQPIAAPQFYSQPQPTYQQMYQGGSSVGGCAVGNCGSSGTTYRRR